MKTGCWRILILLSAMACLTGCFGLLKPSGIEPRYFLLTPLPATAQSPATSGIAVGMGVVKLPDYLLDKTMICRKGTNELTRVPAARWAERLDHGLQRALAVNLSTLLPTGRVRLSTWRPEDVSVEVYVGVEQFDVDDSGHAVLVAQWRTQSPAGRGIQKGGQFRGQRPSESPLRNPAEAAATMSELAAELSRDIAQAITDAGR